MIVLKELISWAIFDDHRVKIFLFIWYSNYALNEGVVKLRRREKYLSQNLIFSSFTLQCGHNSGTDADDRGKSKFIHQKYYTQRIFIFTNLRPLESEYSKTLKLSSIFQLWSERCGEPNRILRWELIKNNELENILQNNPQKLLTACWCLK